MRPRRPTAARSCGSSRSWARWCGCGSRSPRPDVLVDIPSHRGALEPGAAAKVTVVVNQALVAPAGAEPIGAITAPTEVDAITT